MASLLDCHIVKSTNIIIQKYRAQLQTNSFSARTTTAQHTAAASRVRLFLFIQVFILSLQSNRNIFTYYLLFYRSLECEENFQKYHGVNVIVQFSLCSFRRRCLSLFYFSIVHNFFYLHRASSIIIIVRKIVLVHGRIYWFHIHI